jgi:uncharacterized protein YdaT
MRKNVHVVPNGNKWQVKVERSNSSVSTHRTQSKAIEKAIPVAKRNHSEVVIHRPNGQIRDKDSYGHDPFPPRDNKH